MNRALASDARAAAAPRTPALVSFATDDERYAAVARRDRSADGRFWYSVATTGVYCRPSCGARLARRENMAFHASTEAAERAGFRPCKRCRPLDASLAEQHAAAIAGACRRIDTAEGENVPLATLAAEAGLSPHYFHRLFRGVTGITPREYAAARRAERLKDALRSGGTVTHALYEAGFNSSSRMYEGADAMLGMTPGAYARGGAGVAIRHAVAQTSLGPVLVAATERGVCSVRFGESPAALEAELRAQFPQASFAPATPAFGRWVRDIAAYIDAPQGALDIPLDVRGTSFQQRVWKALRAIRAGRTASYAEIAKKIGHPAAVRAVAQACAANPVAVVVPCHRVVRSDGGLSGYRWGVERKRKLLEREGSR
jgi:AraC family transcriptional regulator of adaptative response/methylated-DNA-[protein]-cysteine methyltransferase